MDRGPHTSTEVCGAGVDITKPLIQTEIFSRLLLDGFLNTFDSLGQPGKDSSNISSLLHRDNTELILLIDPDQESLFVIVEDTTTFGPISLHSSNSEVSVSRDKQEVVVNQLLANRLLHTSQWIVVSSQIFREVLDSAHHQFLDSNTLFFSDSGRETKAINRTPNTNSARMNRDIFCDISLNLANIHIRSVLGRGADSMVLTNQRIKNWSKVLVRVPVPSINTAVLVVKLDSTSNSFGQCKSRGLSLNVLKLIPFLLGHMLGDQRVLRCNEGEVTKVFLLIFLVLFPKSIHTIDHLLDQLNLRVSEPVLVGDIISKSSLSTRLSTSTTGLQMQLLTASLKSINTMFGPSRKVDVDRGPHTSAKVGGARVNVAKPVIQTEVLPRLFLHRVLDSLDTLGKSLEYLLYIATHLHGNNTELILFIDPDKESLLVIVEDASTLRPISFHTSNCQIPISGNKQEMVINQLLAHCLIHAC